MEQINKIKNFTDLVVWQEGHELVLWIYTTTKAFPRDELFGLVTQLRRAAVSFTSNIAEGFSQIHFKEKIKFYSISLGSLTEIQSQIFIARDLDYIDKIEANKLFEKITKLNKLTNGLIRKSREFIST